MRQCSKIVIFFPSLDMATIWHYHARFSCGICFSTQIHDLLISLPKIFEDVLHQSIVILLKTYSATSAGAPSSCHINRTPPKSPISLGNYVRLISKRCQYISILDVVELIETILTYSHYRAEIDGLLGDIKMISLSNLWTLVAWSTTSRADWILI